MKLNYAKNQAFCTYESTSNQFNCYCNNRPNCNNAQLLGAQTNQILALSTLTCYSGSPANTAKVTISIYLINGIMKLNQ